MWLEIELAGPGLNSRPGLYLLQDTINPCPINGTGFYSEEASIRRNTVYMLQTDLNPPVHFKAGRPIKAIWSVYVVMYCVLSIVPGMSVPFYAIASILSRVLYLKH